MNGQDKRGEGATGIKIGDKAIYRGNEYCICGGEIYENLVQLETPDPASIEKYFWVRRENITLKPSPHSGKTETRVDGEEIESVGISCCHSETRDNDCLNAVHGRPPIETKFTPVEPTREEISPEFDREMRELWEAGAKLGIPESERLPSKCFERLLRSRLNDEQKVLPLSDSPEPPPTRKCILPECENETRRGYCSAEHCLEHRKRQKGTQK